MNHLSKPKSQLLKERWNALPESAKTPTQVIGKHWVHCGYTLGPAYCSFGCSHCYLPKKSNRVPLVSLNDMKEQLKAQRELMGAGSNIQITGGDVVEAYLREQKSDELIEILQYANGLGLVPMVMTHGQSLLENPNLLDQMVLQGGLRKLSVHIDITMAGRPGYPIKSLNKESQLNPLRDQFVDLIMACRQRTGKPITAAHTVTVSSNNVDSIANVLHWLTSKKDNMTVFRTIGFQTEAQVGRTLNQNETVKPDQVWQAICNSIGQELPRNHLMFGHPDCSSVANLLVDPHSGVIVNLHSQGAIATELWSKMISVFSGIGPQNTARFKPIFSKTVSVLTNPGIIVSAIRYVAMLYRQNKLSLSFLRSLFLGRTRGINIVMHNFMSTQEVTGKQTAIVRDRISACAFKGVIKEDGQWKAVSMCEMNASVRPAIYEKQIKVSGPVAP